MKKVFTKVLDDSGNLAAGTSDIRVCDTWVVQEDIDIIGVELTSEISRPLGNDGSAELRCEVSQSGQLGKDGSIALCNTTAEWNTSPAFGAMRAARTVTMFPAGYGVQVKEEGTVYLFVVAAANDMTAGILNWDVHATIYYVKKG